MNETLSDIIERVKSIVQIIGGPKANDINPDTNLLTEVDLDSMQMLELVEIVERDFNTDRFSKTMDLNDLSSIRTIANVLISDSRD